MFRYEFSRAENEHLTAKKAPLNRKALAGGRVNVVFSRFQIGSSSLLLTPYSCTLRFVDPDLHSKGTTGQINQG